MEEEEVMEGGRGREEAKSQKNLENDKSMRRSQN